MIKERREYVTEMADTVKMRPREYIKIRGASEHNLKHIDHSGIKQTKIIIDFRYRPHRGTGISVR